ncbi:MAG TPA: peptidyl-alpha-hydroxyglycine alpha-amidating lyase family protein [Vicinamibacterales bacterium]|nr:peptidyl-alpha-hydroxyglycine alpha-amidating lyase family protein [Vicinamibacterales bacterium]
MRYARHTLLTALLVVPVLAVAQDAGQPTNDAPNNYNTIKDYFKLPDGRTWGSTSAVDIDKDGTSIWVAERCGPHTPSGNSCLDRTTGKMSDLPSVLKFDSSGKLVKSFGAGLLIFPHGIHVDKDGNVWVTDGQDDAPVPARGAGGAGGAGRGAAGAEGGRGAAPAGPIGPRPGATHGNQVFKFSPDGKVLLTLGKPGGAASPDYFYQPNDVITAPNGDIFVSEGHGAGNNRVLKFDKTGKFIKEWGKLGTGPGDFDQPHALAFDSKGQLYVGDRNNNRVQVFDQNGKYITEYKQWSRPSGLFIKNDILYSADSESESVSQNHYGWKRGIRWGSLKDGKIVGFIPDPETGSNKDATPFRGTSAAEGVAVDKDGNIYGAEVGPKAVKKYVKK